MRSISFLRAIYNSLSLLFSSKHSKGSMYKYLPDAETSCTNPGIFFLNSDTIGITNLSFLIVISVSPAQPFFLATSNLLFSIFLISFSLSIISSIILFNSGLALGFNLPSESIILSNHSNREIGSSKSLENSDIPE